MPTDSDSITMLSSMISYAQNYEDVILRRALQDIDVGFYVDVGCWDPTSDSVTRFFYDQGWHGINIDANSQLMVGFDEQRPRDINLRCAVASRRGTADFHLVGNTGLSSLERPNNVDLGTEIISVELLPLSEIISTWSPETEVDFLKIDVEGSEAEVLRGMDFDLYRPRIILLEAICPATLAPSWSDWEPLLLSRGYRFAYFDGLNRFYLRDEDAWRMKYFDTPVCIWDNFIRHDHEVALAIAKHQSERAADAEGRLQAMWEATVFLRQQLDAASSSNPAQT